MHPLTAPRSPARTTARYPARASAALPPLTSSVRPPRPLRPWPERRRSSVSPRLHPNPRSSWPLLKRRRSALQRRPSQPFHRTQRTTPAKGHARSNRNRACPIIPRNYDSSPPPDAARGAAGRLLLPIPEVIAVNERTDRLQNLLVVAGLVTARHVVQHCRVPVGEPHQIADGVAHEALGVFGRLRPLLHQIGAVVELERRTAERRDDTGAIYGEADGIDLDVCAALIEMVERVGDGVHDAVASHAKRLARRRVELGAPRCEHGLRSVREPWRGRKVVADDL